MTGFQMGELTIYKLVAALQKVATENNVSIGIHVIDDIASIRLQRGNRVIDRHFFLDDAGDAAYKVRFCPPDNYIDHAFKDMMEEL